MYIITAEALSCFRDNDTLKACRLNFSLVYIENCFQGCFSGFMGKIANLSYYFKEALKLSFYFAQF